MLEPTLDGYHHLGQHLLRFEPPDVIHIKFVGQVEPEQFDEFYRWITNTTTQRPLYMLRDDRSGGQIGAKTRARIIRVVNPNDIAAIIAYGTTFERRVILTMLMKAMRIFKKNAPQMVFVEEESDARAWIDAERKRSERSKH